MKAIEVQRLVRRFGGRVAVDALTFAVEPGEVFGFLGPNGAGKTTTIKMLTCQLEPTAGEARLLGLDVRRDQARIKPLIGVVFEEQNLYDRMSARENLEFARRLYRASPNRVDEVIGLVDLKERADERVARYSNGMRQRLLIARALLHQPAIVFLDEPTRGLDPASARDIREFIAGLGRDGVTVFLTTHDMEEADSLCHRVAIMDQGRIVALDTPRALRLAHGRREALVLQRGGEETVFSLDSEPDTERLSRLIRAGEVLSIHSREATLEEAFIELTGKSLTE